MKLAFFLALALAIGGCATSRTIIGQDGKPLHKISCDGAVQSIDACYEKAGELCGSAGYDIVNQGGSVNPFFVASGGTFTSGAAVYRTVFARCRGT
jgi:hypothetical protein